MLNVSQGKEIVLHVKNDMGVLGEIARLVSERGVSIDAVSGTAEGDICTLRLITDDNLRTCDILQEHAYMPVEESVVLLEVPHKPGMLRKMVILPPLIMAERTRTVPPTRPIIVAISI